MIYLAKLCATVRADRLERIKQFAVTKKKMDEDDIEYFWEDVEKVDNLDKCKPLVN